MSSIVSQCFMSLSPNMRRVFLPKLYFFPIRVISVPTISVNNLICNLVWSDDWPKGWSHKAPQWNHQDPDQRCLMMINKLTWSWSSWLQLSALIHQDGAFKCRSDWVNRLYSNLLRMNWFNLIIFSGSQEVRLVCSSRQKVFRDLNLCFNMNIWWK